MGTKAAPGEFDCYHKAAADEPLFVLLARDASAPNIVEEWANQRTLDIEEGARPDSDWPKVREARQCAEAMRRWYRANRAGKS